MVLAGRPVRLRRFLERIGPPQLDMERASLDQRTEPLEDLGVRSAVVGGHLDAVRPLRLGSTPFGWATRPRRSFSFSSSPISGVTPSTPRAPASSVGRLGGTIAVSSSLTATYCA